MKQHTVKIGVFSKKDLETQEGKRMSKTLCRLARPRAVASWNNPRPNTERARIMRELDTVPASNDDRILAAFEDAGSKAIQLHEMLLRLVEMTSKPSKRYLQAKIIGFDRRMREGIFTDLGFIQEAFLMGAEVGADDDMRQVKAWVAPEAQQENAEKGNDRATRKRQKQKADRRKDNAGAERKADATEMMFQLVDEAPPKKRMKQIPASEHVWKKKFSHLKDLTIKPETIRRWYNAELSLIRKPKKT